MNKPTDSSALIASLLALMTRFSCLGSPAHAASIRTKLALLQASPNDQVPKLLKDVASELEEQWHQLYLAIADEHPQQTGTTRQMLH